MIHRTSASCFGLFAALFGSGCIFLYEPADEQGGGAAQGGNAQGGGAMSVGAGGAGGGMCAPFPPPKACPMNAAETALPNAEEVMSLGASPVTGTLSAVAIGPADVFVVAGKSVARFPKNGATPASHGSTPGSIHDVEVLGGKVYCAVAGQPVHVCDGPGCSPLSVDMIGAWRSFVRLPSDGDASMFAAGPQAGSSIYLMNADGETVETANMLGAGFDLFRGLQVDALSPEQVAFSLRNQSTTFGIVYRNIPSATALPSQTWAPVGQQTDAVAVRGDGTVFVMVGDQGSQSLYQWQPEEPNAAPVTFNISLDGVPPGSPLRYNPETDLLYAVAQGAPAKYTLAACRCGQCVQANASCDVIGGIDVERDPCDPHHGAAYFSCDNLLMRWDFVVPQ